MEENEILHGFRVQYIQPLPELKATLYRLVYEQNGADLIWLERKDDNKTFAIAFKTIPQDDTGVFHILEHSVLSGSRKYPIKAFTKSFVKRLSLPFTALYASSSPSAVKCISSSSPIAFSPGYFPAITSA